MWTEEIKIKNAIITNATISKGDHGILSIWLSLDYHESGCQGFGGYVLYSPYKPENQINFAGHFIWRIMEIIGVEDWDKIPYKTIRVKANMNKVYEIGHIVKDDWFNPTTEFNKLKECSDNKAEGTGQ